MTFHASSPGSTFDVQGPDYPKQSSKEVRFAPDDPEDPRKWPTWRKMLSFLPLIPLDLAVSIGASGFSPATTKFTEAWGVSSEVGVLGLSMYTLALGFGPLVNAPASEYFGRRPIYIVSYGLALPFYVGSALSPTLGGFLITRFLCGFFQSVTLATIGGTVADLFTHHKTGYPMSIFIWAATGGSSLGFFLLSFVAQYLQAWQWVLWVTLAISGSFYIIAVAAIMYCGETRHGVILRRRAARMRQETGDESIDVAPEYKAKSLKQVLYTTQTRPWRFLGTEPVVIFGALYNGYLYGLSFLLNGAFTLVFGPMGHGLSILQVGLCFLGIFGGISVGPLTHIIQEKYYQKRVAQAGQKNLPEARLMMGKIAGITFPISLFWFAWTTYPSINPAVPVLATALWGWSFYTLILMTFQYTEDAYKQYSASALAGLGFVRNIAGGGFPLFGNQMFENEGYQWAGSILAFLALVMVPIPFVLDHYGLWLRKKSPWAWQHVDDIDE